MKLFVSELFTNNKMIIIIVLAVAVLMTIMYFTRNKELLTNVSDKIVSVPHEHETETRAKDEQITPTIFDAGSGTIMSAPEFVPSQFLSPWYKAYTGNIKNQYLLDDGSNGANGLQFNMCSKACCSEQYPLPFKMPVSSEVCASKSEFVPNNYMCNNAWEDSGCVCMTKEQANFIGSRGGNA